MRVHRRIWRKIARQRILIKQHNRCIYCHCPLAIGTLEHIKPQKDGGTDNDNNLSVACLECNRAKGSMSVGKFKKIIKSTVNTNHARRKTHIACMRSERSSSKLIKLE